MTAVSETALAVPAADRIVFAHVSWGYYERTVRELEEQHLHMRVTYDQGRMEIMSPSGRHERVKTVIRMLIEAYAQEREIVFMPLGSVTCKREDLLRGLEPDECYYVLHIPNDPDDLDLRRDPPPDLAIEVEITRKAIPQLPIYAALGVPEVWRYDGRRLVILHRQSDGSYREADRSISFPQLPLGILRQHLERALSGSMQGQFEAVRAFREWARQQT